MCPNEADFHLSVHEQHYGHEAELVASDIEDVAVIAYIVGLRKVLLEF